MPNIAAVTFGFSVNPSSNGARQRAGRKRSTGEPGAGFPARCRCMRRKFERVVVRLASAVRSCVLPAASCASDCATSVRVTSPTLNRSRGLFQRLLEHANVALLNLDDRGVLQIVHVDGGPPTAHALFEHPQRFARAGNLTLGRSGSVAVCWR